MEYHLQNRGFNKELLELLAPMYGENVVFFWLWNTMGQLAGYQQYRPNAPKEKRNEPRTGRYYTYRTPEHAYVIGGLETLHFSHEVFLVEGIFDAVQVWRQGYACLFTCGTPSPVAADFVKNRLNRPVAALLDPGLDKESLADGRGSPSLKMFKKASHVQVRPEDYNVFTDLGDAESWQVEMLMMYGLQKLSQLNHKY